MLFHAVSTTAMRYDPRTRETYTKLRKLYRRLPKEIYPAVAVKKLELGLDDAMALCALLDPACHIELIKYATWAANLYTLRIRSLGFADYKPYKMLRATVEHVLKVPMMKLNDQDTWDARIARRDDVKAVLEARFREMLDYDRFKPHPDDWYDKFEATNGAG